MVGIVHLLVKYHLNPTCKNYNDLFKILNPEKIVALSFAKTVTSENGKHVVEKIKIIVYQYRGKMPESNILF